MSASLHSELSQRIQDIPLDHWFAVSDLVPYSHRASACWLYLYKLVMAQYSRASDNATLIANEGKTHFLWLRKGAQS